MQSQIERFLSAQADNYSNLLARIDSFPPIEEQDFLRVLQAWERGGLLGLGTNADGSIRTWSNVCIHQMAVAQAGYEVALHFIEPLRAEGMTPDKICLALLVHDSTKRENVMWVLATNHITYDGYMRQIQREVDILREVGFEKDVARLASVTNEYGLDRVLSGKASLAEMIALFVDMTVSESEWVAYTTRIARVQKNFDQGGQYNNWLRYYDERYGIAAYSPHWERAGAIMAQEFQRHLGDHDFLRTPWQQLVLD